MIDFEELLGDDTFLPSASQSVLGPSLLMYILLSNYFVYCNQLVCLCIGYLTTLIMWNYM